MEISPPNQGLDVRPHPELGEPVTDRVTSRKQSQ